jgi:YVTN family beta-propeller protein
MSLHRCVPSGWGRHAKFAALLLCFLICVACGDVYRPTIIPNPVPIPPPQNFHTAFVVNQNGTVNRGTGMQVDVSGDSNAGTTKVAMNPVHATVLGGSLWVANFTSDSVSVFSEAQGTAGSIGAATDINLIPGSKPVFVASTDTSTMYVANSGQLKDQNTGQAYFAVDAILNATTPSAAVVAEIRLPDCTLATPPPPLTPSALAETPDKKKLYVVNRDCNNVTVINTVDNTINTTLSTGIGASPRWVLARSDSTRVYVLANDGTLSTIDTTQSVDQVISSIPVGAGADSVYYDSHLNRLYIPNPSNSTVSFYDVTADPPSLVTTIDLTKPLASGGSAPCPATGCFPLSVAPLPDGSRAYVASFYIDSTSANCTQTPCVQSQLTAINTLNNQVMAAISLPEASVSTVANCASLRFRVSAAAAADSTRVYLASCDAGGVYSVRTSDNTYVVTVNAPVSAYTPPAVNITSAAQSGSSTTFTYTMISGIPLFLGMPISITGIANPGDTTLNPDNGTFTVRGLGAGTFTVTNPQGVSTTAAQTAVGLGQPPPQNPAFMVAGP